MKVSSVPDSLEIFGVPVSAFNSYEHAEDCILQRVRQGRRTFCVAINPEKIYRAQKDKELKELIDAADFHICDGIGTTIAVRFLHGEKIARITGVQLFLNLIARAEKEGLNIFLLGATPESNEGACRKLKAMHPNLEIVGRQNGYFKDDIELIRRINDSRADMLFVGMGSPQQEKWIIQHRDVINASYCMGVGGTFDVLSGKVKWAPSIFRKTGTEFIYRLIREPKRWRRQLALPQFAWSVLTARVATSKRRVLGTANAPAGGDQVLIQEFRNENHKRSWRTAKLYEDSAADGRLQEPTGDRVCSGTHRSALR